MGLELARGHQPDLILMDINRTKKVGFVDYIVKPFKVDKFLEVLDCLLIDKTQD